MELNDYAELGGAWSLGARWNQCLSVTWPFARIIVNARRIILRILWRKYEFERNDVVQLRRYGGFLPLTTGIRIAHSIAGYPYLIVYWPLKFKRFTRHLHRLGYTIEGTCTWGSILRKMLTLSRQLD